MSTKCRNSSAFVPLKAINQRHEAGVFLEKFRGFQLVQKFTEFYETGRFITVFTTAPHFLPPSARQIKSKSLYFRPILILSTHICLGLPGGRFLSGS